MGGMTMVGDMFNNGLQATVSNLCGELSNAQANAAFFSRRRPSLGLRGGQRGWARRRQLAGRTARATPISLTPAALHSMRAMGLA